MGCFLGVFRESVEEGYFNASDTVMFLEYLDEDKFVIEEKMIQDCTDDEKMIQDCTDDEKIIQDSTDNEKIIQDCTDDEKMFQDVDNFVTDDEYFLDFTDDQKIHMLEKKSSEKKVE